MKRCAESFGCVNLNETVHFKFERFETESGYDYFIIGNPEDFQDSGIFDDDFGEDDHAEEVTMPVVAEPEEPVVAVADEDFKKSHRVLSHNISDDRSGLFLDGRQQTNIWVTAESIINFDIFFIRRALENPMKSNFL